MKKHKLLGMGTVFRYTVKQHYKSPSVLILLAILLLLSLAAFPIMITLSGGEDSVSEDISNVQVLMLQNDTPYVLDAADLLADERFKDMAIRETEDCLGYLQENLEEEGLAAVCISMDAETMTFQLNGYYPAEGTLSDGDLHLVHDMLKTALHEALLHSLSVTNEQLETVHSRSYSTVSTVEAYRSGGTDISIETFTMISMFYSYAVLILCALSMSYIFQLCMEEKVSKLVEALLVSVEPMALLVGKILAVTLFIFVGIGVVAGGLVTSWLLAKQIGDVSAIQTMLETTFSVDLSMLHIDGLTITLTVVCVLLAYGVGAFFSGIVGSCCSKTEDTQTASIAVVLFLMVGYMLASFLPMMESDTANLVFALIPLSGMFTALPNFVCGKISLLVFLVSLVLQGGMVYLLARAAGAVYRMMLLYRGNVPKPAQLFRMLKAQHKTEKEAQHAGK